MFKVQLDQIEGPTIFKKDIQKRYPKEMSKNNFQKSFPKIASEEEISTI